MGNRLFIFDLDGVLVDSKEIHYNALNQALMLVDKKYTISLEEQRETFEGLTTNQKLQILTNSRGLPEYKYDLIWKNKQLNSITFFKELKTDIELINIFKAIKDNEIKIAVASNSIQKTVETCLTSLGVINFLDFYISNEGGVLPKPNPDMYVKCIDNCESNIDNTTIFEDSYTGRLGAFKSGARVVSVENRKDLTMKKVMNEINKENKRVNVLIPMAGEGSRFRAAGYTLPKPLIDVNGKSMIQVVCENLDIDANYIFVAQKNDINQYNIDEHLALLSKNFTLIEQDDKLDGAAKSCLLAERIIDNDLPLLIANSDQYVEWDARVVVDNFIKSGIDGSILTFTSTDTKWSYAKTNEHGTVSAVAEKNVISNDATCGIYYWKHGSDFVKYARQMIEKNIKTNNDFYVCPVYNEAIADEKIITIHKVDSMHGLGTPDDLNLFLQKGIIK
jgi:beta-phosphoglucomutase-like phosphatase (HAD superfamily)/dTDP-glucose pyrophosphorylase